MPKPENALSTVHLNSELLDALVASVQDRGAVKATTVNHVSTRPAERELHIAQAKVVGDLADYATRTAGAACTVADAEMEVISIGRFGHRLQSMAVEFGCSLPPDECCSQGLEAAVGIVRRVAELDQAGIPAVPIA